MQELHNSHTLSLIFTIAVVASILVQAVVAISFFALIAKTLNKLTSISESLSLKAGPLVADVHSVVQDITPKIKVISENIVDISDTVREQTKHVNVTVDEVVDKTRAQAVKVDDMVSAVLGSIAHAGTVVQDSVTRPVRQVSGVLRGIRVGLETLVQEEKK